MNYTKETIAQFCSLAFVQGKMEGLEEIAKKEQERVDDLLIFLKKDLDRYEENFGVDDPISKLLDNIIIYVKAKWDKE